MRNLLVSHPKQAASFFSLLVPPILPLVAFGSPQLPLPAHDLSSCWRVQAPPFPHMVQVDHRLVRAGG